MFSERGEMVSELKDALYDNTETGTEADNAAETENGDETESSFQSSADSEASGHDTLSDAFEPVITDISDDDDEPAPSPEEMIRDSMSAVRRMKLEIEAENANLDQRFAGRNNVQGTQAVQRRRPTYVIGVLSCAASLVFMGVALLISVMTSPVGAYAAIRLSPLMLVFLGAEIIYAVIRKHSLRIRIDIRSIVIIVCLMVISAILSTVSVVASSGNGERLYAEQRIQNMLASELHDTIAKDYIRSVDIETQLFGEYADMYNTPADLTDGDIINLTINFSDAQMTIREFAKDCKDVIDDIHKLPYNFGTISFVADDRVNHYVLNVDWHYQSDFSADKLAGLVNYFGDGISDMDIPDSVDDE